MGKSAKGLNYEYYSISDAIERIQYLASNLYEELEPIEETIKASYFELKRQVVSVLSNEEFCSKKNSKDELESLWNEAEKEANLFCEELNKFLWKFFQHKLTDLLITNCQQFSKNEQYPACLIGDAARFLCQDNFAQASLEQRVIQSSFEEQITKIYTTEWTVYIGVGIENFSDILNLFKSSGFDLVSAQTNKRLNSSFSQSISGRGKYREKDYTYPKYFSLFYLSLLETADFQKGKPPQGHGLVQETFVRAFLEPFKELAKDAKHEWPFRGGSNPIKSTIQQCIKKRGKVTTEARRELKPNQTPKEALPPEFRKLVEDVKTANYRLPKDWKKRFLDKT